MSALNGKNESTGLEDWITIVDGIITPEGVKSIPDMTIIGDDIGDQLAQLTFFREEGVDIDGDDPSSDKGDNTGGLLDEADEDGDDIDPDITFGDDMSTTQYREAVQDMLIGVEEMILATGQRHLILASI
jgi:hypothetical protein